ncbi:Sensory histidine kinase QseC [Paramagnetospirillum magnetotacticum MS-1]|uniref:histidine kinase n=1 Tax=Paramagnetospirillum magnetotacticum MS-1 TaxID=272627 RepID=A0A0C2UGR2_PARME|nr:ATP-binding protein [Paramagnetospirillum magnetotacticum]KIM00763.1 Sensory histidine kinase QseC [Paramagnetospirillum magnetotacticum MS-1]
MIRQPPAILWRIVFRLSLTTLVAIVLAYSWLWWKYHSVTEVMRDQLLSEFVSSVAVNLRATPDGSVAVNMSEATLAYYANTTDNDFRFSIRDAGTGTILKVVGGDVGEPPKEAIRALTLYQYNPDGPGPMRMFGAAMPSMVGDRKVVVQVEESGRDFEAITQELVRKFATEGGWLGAPFLLAMLLVSLVTIRNSLLPLQRLSEQAAGIGPSSTDIRLPEAGVPREIMPLVKAINSALDRIEAGFRIQRDFTADAAHELRTPLAVLRAHVETLPDPATRDALVRDLESMTRLIAQLLTVARAEALTVAMDEQADLNAIAVDVGTFLAPMALKQHRMIEVIESPSPCLITANAEAVFNALRNLVENALTHTPADSTVSVRVENPAILRVEDRGPGIPAQLRDRIFQRFWRAERRKSGSGLGLAIVREIMMAHSGRVEVEDRPGGGAIFSLIFPDQGAQRR